MFVQPKLRHKCIPSNWCLCFVANDRIGISHYRVGTVRHMPAQAPVWSWNAGAADFLGSLRVGIFYIQKVQRYLWERDELDPRRLIYKPGDWSTTGTYHYFHWLTLLRLYNLNRLARKAPVRLTRQRGKKGSGACAPAQTLSLSYCRTHTLLRKNTKLR